MVPATPEPEKIIAALLIPLHKARSPGLVTVGVGLTVIVNVLVVPAQGAPLVKVGVTMIVAVTVVVPVLVAVNEAMSPDPLAARPIEGVLLVQL